MAKKKAAAPEPAGESAPMWIVSFADLVTLLMSFFVVLYATKQGGAAQQMERSAAIAAQFGYVPPADSDRPVDDMVRRRLGMPTHNDNSGFGQSNDANQGAEGAHPDVQTIRDGKPVNAGIRISFESGQADLSANAQKAVVQIAGLVKGHNNVLYVKGHASIDEGATRPDDPNATTLSLRRAQAVVEQLVKLGIDRRILRPIPCGTFEPVQTGVYDVVGMAINRRVEVFSTDATATDFFPARTVDADKK